MDGSMGIGLMALFAVSGSAVLIAREFHKSLLSDFMKKIEFQLGSNGTKKCLAKKRVRFAEDVMEPSSKNKEYRRRKRKKKVMLTGVDPTPPRTVDSTSRRQNLEKMMPLNRQNLYKGITQYKATLKGFSV